MDVSSIQKCPGREIHTALLATVCNLIMSVLLYEGCTNGIRMGITE